MDVVAKASLMGHFAAMFVSLVTFQIILILTIVHVQRINCLLIKETRSIKDTGVKFSQEFIDFLEALDRKVYNLKQKKVESNSLYTNAIVSKPNKAYLSNLKDKGRTVLEDVLMMKLVSYYEDKYKLNKIFPQKKNSEKSNSKSISQSIDRNNNEMTGADTREQLEDPEVDSKILKFAKKDVTINNGKTTIQPCTEFQEVLVM